LGRKLSPIAHLAALVGVAVAVLLSGNAIAWALEDCAAAYERQDYSAALQLCRPLAEQGDARAQLSLGGMYYNDQGVQQGYSEAAKWTRKAAEQGYTPAQAHLGVLYWNGQGVQQDVVLAYMWLSLASANEPDAVRERDLAASQMTPDEIAEAQRLAREWKPTTPSP
jgi:TPR repeat protein